MTPKLCPHCGKPDTLMEVGTPLVEAGPYVEAKSCYSAEGYGTHYECLECKGQFIDWSTDIPRLERAYELAGNRDELYTLYVEE